MLQLLLQLLPFLLLLLFTLWCRVLLLLLLLRAVPSSRCKGAWACRCVTTNTK